MSHRDSLQSASDTGYWNRERIGRNKPRYLHTLWWSTNQASHGQKRSTTVSPERYGSKAQIPRSGYT
jgi:hypothetical protein